eukprot:c22264_g1_i1 orf=116-988(+)
MTSVGGLIWKRAWNTTHLSAGTGFATIVLGRRTPRYAHIFSKKLSSATVVASVSASYSTTTASNHLYGGKQVIQVNQPLYDYLLAHTREPQVLCELREETSSIRGSQMQVSPDQGQFLAMLVRLMGAERCIEVGVYTGYSSLAVAMALPACGRLVACERDHLSLGVAQKYYERAGVAQKVDVYHGMAIDTLRMLLAKGEANSYDFAFLDADKKSYGDYYELLLQLVRSGGLVVIDNVLWHGKVVDPKVSDETTESLRRFNEFIRLDTRIDVSMVPVGDGMTLCRKREVSE